MIRDAMRVLFAAVLFALALSAHASYEIQPPLPTSGSYVTLQVRHWWRDSCRPYGPRVTRTGNQIEVLWKIAGGGCTSAVVSWETDVLLGMLPAGEYAVVLKEDDRSFGVRVIATRSFVVSQSQPAFRAEPNVVSGAVSTDVTIHASRCLENAVVMLDGVAVPVRGPTNCAASPQPVIATLPPHVAGAVNLRVQADGYDEEVVAAVAYISPQVAPDSSLYERVLVPVLINGAGAYGAQWESEVEVINASTSTMTFIPEVTRPLTSIAPGESVKLEAFGNRPVGLILFLLRGYDVRFGGVFRDVSREASDWGTELPIVRESETSDRSLTLANVPLDPRYRVQLRIYGIEGQTAEVRVSVSRQGEQYYRVRTVPGPCRENYEEPCDSNQPAYLSLDLSREFSSLQGRYRIDVEPAREYEPPRLWAFVSVTNNDTQHVTLITPQ